MKASLTSRFEQPVGGEGVSPVGPEGRGAKGLSRRHPRRPWKTEMAVVTAMPREGVNRREASSCSSAVGPTGEGGAPLRPRTSQCGIPCAGLPTRSKQGGRRLLPSGPCPASDGAVPSSSHRTGAPRSQAQSQLSRSCGKSASLWGEHQLRGEMAPGLPGPAAFPAQRGTGPRPLSHGQKGQVCVRHVGCGLCGRRGLSRAPRRPTLPLHGTRARHPLAKGARARERPVARCGSEPRPGPRPGAPSAQRACSLEEPRSLPLRRPLCRRR